MSYLIGYGGDVGRVRMKKRRIIIEEGDEGSEEIWKQFDATFDKFNETFAEMDKLFKTIFPRKR